MKRSRIRRKQRSGLAEYNKAREALAEQAAYRCQARTPNCNGQLEQVHHRKGRDGELLTNPEYLLGVCYPCHSYIHANPSESYERGWMIRRNDGGLSVVE